MRRRWTVLAAALVAAAAVGARPLDARLAFSRDGGKTWSADFPTVPAGSVLKVRAAYAISDDWEQRDVITASISCPDRFASATKALPGGGFMQRDHVYWKSSRGNGTFAWTLDTTGLAPGGHCLLLTIRYWRKGAAARLVDDSQPFYVTLTEPEARK